MLFVLRRLFSSLVVLFGASVCCFFLITLAPGSFVSTVSPNYQTLSLEEKKVIAQKYGLDLPVYIQYFKWLKNVVHGDLGYSYIDGKPVGQKISGAFPHTLYLTLSSLLLAFVISVPLALALAKPRSSLLARVFAYIFYVISASPSFWLGLILIYSFSVTNRWLPVSGSMDVRAFMFTGSVPFSDRLLHLILPCVTLGLGNGMTSELMRHIRIDIEDVMTQDYIRTAHAKGLGKTIIAYKHVLKNAMIPVISFMVHRVPFLLGGAVVVERVFAWPGLGRLAINSITNRDYPVVLGICLVTAVFVVVSSFVGDILLTTVDPRVRFDNVSQNDKRPS